MTEIGSLHLRISVSIAEVKIVPPSISCHFQSSLFVFERVFVVLLTKRAVT